jgi:hypothetical protein
MVRNPNYKTNEHLFLNLFFQLKINHNKVV